MTRSPATTDEIRAVGAHAAVADVFDRDALHGVLAEAAPEAAAAEAPAAEAPAEETPAPTETPAE